MAYKYEDMVVKEMEGLGCDLEQTNYFDVSKELQEVYRKAKAFDRIVDIEDDFVKYHGFSPCVEEYAEEVEDIIGDYEEDE